ncbi:hypothetical protein BE11_36540 [Sorangium cellulosum]|nr:hypothetical protein BE11_36540 [Sorangium cellulosum]
MRRGPEPAELREFKAAANADWTPRYRDLDKKPARAALAREQGYLCGYCESRIGERDGDCQAASDPAKHEAAKQTIRVLCLDIGRLKAARRAAIEGALEGLDGLSSDDWRTEAARYDQPGADGRLVPFCSAIQHVLLNYA